MTEKELDGFRLGFFTLLKKQFLISVFVSLKQDVYILTLNIYLPDVRKYSKIINMLKKKN